MIEKINDLKEYSDDEEIWVDLNDLVDIRESEEVKAAADAFDRCMEEYARKTHMTQEELSEICELAAQATKRAMEVCFLKGFEMGVKITKGFLEEEKENQDFPGSTLPVS